MRMMKGMELKALEAFRLSVRRQYPLSGLTQVTLAERAGISEQHLNRILKGIVSPSLEVCDQIANALGVPLIELLDTKNSFATVDAS